jgi:hypothetical protein
MKEDCKQLYGSEYPAAYDLDGIRVPLSGETRFTRQYHSEEHRRGTATSRLFDGSASITMPQLEREWGTWDSALRDDFCSACMDIFEEPGLPEMIRFMACHARPDDWRSLLSYLVAAHLPGDEAFGFLKRALAESDDPSRLMILQAIAITKHPEAALVLRRHLAIVRADKTLWDEGLFVNWLAATATTCIRYLIELGAPPTEFDGLVRQLAAHVCPRNRGDCRRELSKHYAWLA